MEITNSVSFGKTVSAMARDPSVDKRGGVFGAEVSRLAHERNEARHSAASAATDTNVSITVGDEQNSLNLVLKTSIGGVNTALESAGLEPVAIQAPVNTLADVSPEAITPDTVASQIVILSTIAFGAYQEANPELELADQLSQFVSLVLSGIDEGFAEARGTLDQVGALDDNSTRIDATYELVTLKLTAFAESFTADSVVEEPSVVEPTAEEPATEITEPTEEVEEPPV